MSSASSHFTTTAAAQRAIFVVLNRGSGKRRTSEVALRLRDMAHAANQPCEVRVVHGARDMMAAIKQARSGPYCRIVAGGGDGTLNAVASSLVGTQKEFGVLPLGTFNYFAKDFGLPLQFEDAFKYCLHGEARSISVGELNGIPFLNSSSVGVYSKVLKAREHTYATFGRNRLSAYWAVLQAVTRFRVNLRAQISTDHAPAVPVRTPMIFVGRNAAQLESFELPGGECVANDVFAAYVLPESDRMGLAKLAILMAMGKIKPQKDVWMLCASELRVDLPQGRWLAAIDGEIRVVSPPLIFRIRRNALRAVLPNRPAT